MLAESMWWVGWDYSDYNATPSSQPTGFSNRSECGNIQGAETMRISKSFYLVNHLSQVLTILLFIYIWVNETNVFYMVYYSMLQHYKRLFRYDKDNDLVKGILSIFLQIRSK